MRWLPARSRDTLDPVDRRHVVRWERQMLPQCSIFLFATKSHSWKSLYPIPTPTGVIDRTQYSASISHFKEETIQ